MAPKLAAVPGCHFFLRPVQLPLLVLDPFLRFFNLFLLRHELALATMLQTILRCPERVSPGKQIQRIKKPHISPYIIVLVEYSWCPEPESNRHAISGEGF